MNWLDKALKIAEGFNSSIYQLSDSPYGQDVVLKVMKEDFNYHPHSSQLYNEDNLLRNVKIKGVRSSLDLIKDQQTPILVLEYFNGKSLKAWRKQATPTLIDCLKIAIQITESISEIHASLNLIHRDITSHNILINHNLETSIIDFGLAINVDIRQSIKGMNDQLLGTLPYISPEQTGRVNHPVDSRSDLYSLGIVLYELFTGELPFFSYDPLEIIHAHLAVSPKAPHELNPEIPLIFSDIILKLMSKDAEHRYQSARGLLEDLRKCMQQAVLKVEVVNFRLAQHDESGRFLIPSKIYGRETETKQLIQSIAGIGRSPKEITLVSGRSGTGKTSLIYEIHKPITQLKGYFVKGKHQQFQKDRPYQAISEAFGGFISLLLSENEQQLTQWKFKLRSALGEQGKLLTDLIPKLELIVGKQEKLPVLNINEAQNRFNYIFTQFIRTIATEEHPLVMFIDDLQWADTASLKLLKSLITDPSLEYFYFIGAFRDNEVNAAHPMHLVFKELPKLGIQIREITLTDLNYENTRQLIIDTFATTMSKAHELASIVHSKTAGNPFFVIQFLKSIYEKGLVKYVHGTENARGYWEWDIKGLETTTFTENVVEFMVEKLRKLDIGAQKQLMLGACIGDHFDIQTLSYIQEPKPAEMLEDLWKSVIEQLLVVEESKGYTALVGALQFNSMDNSIVYRFAHDRIRQAAYELIPKEEKTVIHQRIGELLLKNINLTEEPDRVFEIVNQLNKGIPQQEKTYRTMLARLNYEAGSRAMESTAYDSALSHFSKSIQWVEEKDWQENHEEIFEIHLSAMEAYYILGQYKEMNALGNLLLERANTKMQKLRTHNIVIHSFIAETKHLELIEYGAKVLKEAGISIPTKPNDIHILKELGKTKLKLRNKETAFFRKLPEMKDESLALAINMMTSMSTAAFHNYPKLFPLVILKSVQLSIKHGNTIDSVPFYGGYGTILCGVLGEYDKGFEFGKLSLHLLAESDEYRPVIPKTLVIYYCFINHWKEHLSYGTNPLEEALLIALEIGDSQYAASAAYLRFYNMFLSGSRLTELVPEAKDLSDRMYAWNQEGYHQYHKIMLQSAINLTSEGENPWELEGKIFSLKVFKSPDFNKHLQQDDTALFLIDFAEMYLNFHFGRYEEAYLAALETKKRLESVVSTIFVGIHNFFYSLACIQLCRTKTGKEKSKLIDTVRKNQKQMKKWADHAPANFMHKYLLVEAELLSLTETSEAVKDLYNKAIKFAEENDYVNELALICELAAVYFQKKDDVPLEEFYITKALKSYRKWGATAKVLKIKREYPNIHERPHQSLVGTISEGSFSYGSLSGNNLLDLATVLKAASTISSEIQLSKAIPTLLNILTENAGAQSGAFLLVNNKKVELQAISGLNKEAHMIEPLPLDQVTNLPLSVIQYVLRTQDTVLSSEPQKDDRFMRDKFLQENEIASLLCMPVIHQKEMLGIIYLENRLTKGSFTPNRTDLISLLSGQIAITLHNAMLYDNLEQKVEERTHEIEKQKEKLNRQNLQLTELNEEKDFLISIVSHDLRNPLQLVKGYTKLAMKQNDREQMDEFLGYVIESSQKMEQLISRILNISAINNQEIAINYTEVQMIDLLQKEFENFLPMAEQKQIALTFNSEAESLITSIDTGYFSQIIGNLISNALKYTHQDGTVDIKLEIKDNKEYYRIVVKDNGQGIQRRELKLLFSKFQKLSSVPTAGETSTGLGLAIVKKYVEAMDGLIWCESEYEKGSTFYVEFPIHHH